MSVNLIRTHDWLSEFMHRRGHENPHSKKYFLKHPVEHWSTGFFPLSVWVAGHLTHGKSLTWILSHLYGIVLFEKIWQSNTSSTWQENNPLNVRTQYFPCWNELIPIEFYLPITIVVIPDVLVTNLITKLSKSCLVVMTCQTMLAGMKVSVTGTQNSHDISWLTQETTVAAKSWQLFLWTRILFCSTVTMELPCPFNDFLMRVHFKAHFENVSQATIYTRGQLTDYKHNTIL